METSAGGSKPLVSGDYRPPQFRIPQECSPWALFLTQFNFKVTYRPGHKNTKDDALSHLHSLNLSHSPSSPLHLSYSVGDGRKQIAIATREEPAPPGRPDGCTYVTSTLHVTLMNSVHLSPASGHPGYQQTLLLLRERYWWPSMTQDVQHLFEVCYTCAISRHLPEGKLLPLPIPNRPWSHLGIDFVTDFRHPLTETPASWL